MINLGENSEKKSLIKPQESDKVGQKIQYLLDRIKFISQTPIEIEENEKAEEKDIVDELRELIDEGDYDLKKLEGVKQEVELVIEELIKNESMYDAVNLMNIFYSLELSELSKESRAHLSVMGFGKSMIEGDPN